MNGSTKLSMAMSAVVLTLPIKLLIGDWCRLQEARGVAVDIDAMLEMPVAAFIEGYTIALAEDFQALVLKDLPESDLTQDAIVLEAWKSLGPNWLKNRYGG